MYDAGGTPSPGEPTDVPLGDSVMATFTLFPGLNQVCSQLHPGDSSELANSCLLIAYLP